MPDKIIYFKPYFVVVVEDTLREDGVGSFVNGPECGAVQCHYSVAQHHNDEEEAQDVADKYYNRVGFYAQVIEIHHSNNSGL